MGLFSGFDNVLDIFDAPTQELGDLFGKEDLANQIGDPLDFSGIQGGQAAQDAADIQNQRYMQGLALLREMFNQSQSNIQPFMAAGERALPGLAGQTTVQGLDATLQQIMDTDMFESLLDERMRGAQGMLAAGGLSRSGTAMEAGAAIPTDLALELANLIRGNSAQLASMGQNAAVGAGSNAMNFGNQGANQLGLSGNALASGILGTQQAQAQGAQGAAGILAKIFGFG